jgi:hypothetical protein
MSATPPGAGVGDAVATFGAARGGPVVHRPVCYEAVEQIGVGAEPRELRQQALPEFRLDRASDRHCGDLARPWQDSMQENERHESQEPHRQERCTTLR